jgi:hypothetical protein
MKGPTFLNPSSIPCMGLEMNMKIDHELV